MFAIYLAHLLSYYPLIQLNLPLIEIRNLNLNLGRAWYVIMHRHKYFCYYLFNICKSRVLYYRYAFTAYECLSADKIVLRHPLKGFTGIFMIVYIFIIYYFKFYIFALVNNYKRSMDFYTQV